MSRTVVLPQGTYAIGTRNVGPASLPSSVSAFTLELDGTNMTNPALSIVLTVDLSLDGGVTWASQNPGPTTNPFPITAEIDGGGQNKDGSPATVYSLGSGFPGVGLTTRQVKATVTIVGTPLTTTGTLSLTP